MFCSDACRLLDQGVIPNSSDPQRAMLGFHLAGCASCRIYRKEMDELRLLSAMLAQTLRAPHARTKATRRHHRTALPLRVAGAALVIGGALAMVPCSGLMPATATAAQAKPGLPATAHSRRASEKRARPRHRRALQAGDTALLRDLLARPTGPANVQTNLVAQAQIADAELEVGQELAIPTLPTSAATSSAGIQAAPLQQTAQFYVVQPGDSLWAIAVRFYGNGELWQTIYQANKSAIGNNPNLIYPNQRFTIPAAPAVPTPQPAPPAPPAPQTGTGLGLYTIVSGDTLSDIALRAYGDANRWHDIYANNLAAIGGNPDLIYPGTVLTL